MSSIINVPKPKSFFSGKKKDYLKKVLIILGAIILVAGLIGGIWFYLESRKQAYDQKIYDISNNSNDVVADIVAGDYDKAQDKLDENLDYSEDKELQANIYIQKSAVSFNAGNYDDSYDYAKKSEELNPTHSSAKMMAESLAKKNDTVGAIKNYKLAIERIVGEGELFDIDRESLQNKINALEAKK